MICRFIAPEWAKTEKNLTPVIEGNFTDDEIADLNIEGYNVYYFPNSPVLVPSGSFVNSHHIESFHYVFVDMDLKDGTYTSKDAFIEHVLTSETPIPSMIIDSGHGIHVYWQVSDLSLESYLQFQRRLMRKFNTDEAVSKIAQLMRVPGTLNTKNKDEFFLCEKLFDSGKVYTCEDLDKTLSPLTPQDAIYVSDSIQKVHPTLQNVQIEDKIPPKFAHLLQNNKEVKAIWAGGLDDRSGGDYRLGHIMFANGFTRQEAASVLINAAKALTRAPAHRQNYATNIIDKIWTYELLPESAKSLSNTVREILQRGDGALRGTPFRCHSFLDDTDYGFRLGQVIGLVAGSGVGKTAMALNMFEGFVKSNPDFHHFFVPLEQPTNEIAERWAELCGSDTAAQDKVHVISNYDDDGSFRHLSFTEIEEYLVKFQAETGKKVGCVVIDHIGALNKKGAKGENQDLMDICHTMKAFSIKLNCLLVMQSQAPREKAGIGDLELDKSAAYGTVYFESYCDYLVAIWQPLKRCYDDPACPTVTAFKFAKIRHKKKHIDKIQEDVRYLLAFDSKTGRMSPMTQDNEKSFNFWNAQSVEKRKQDRKSDILSYTSTAWVTNV